MKRYSTIHPLFMSFYSKSLYQDVGKNWKKISYLYLLLLLAVCLIPVMFKTHSAVSHYLLNEAPKIVKQIPVISISKGQVSADVRMPYIIKDPENNATLIIIDTTGQVDSLKNSAALALLTKTKLMIRKSPDESRTLDLSGIDTLVINQSKVYDWIDTFLEYFPFVLYPFSLLFSFLLRLIQAIIYALISAYYSKYLKLILRYYSLISLSIVSMTPAIILDTIYNYIDIAIPFWWAIDFFIALGYLFFAVKSNSEQEIADTSTKL